ncbi:hypothetical protein [Streptomyces decoyicus]
MVEGDYAVPRPDTGLIPARTPARDEQAAAQGETVALTAMLDIRAY